MSKKDYELIAQVFALHKPTRYGSEFVVWEDMRSTMADRLAAGNPAFHRGKFIVACAVGLKEGVTNGP